METQCLQTFLKLLEERGELRRIRDSVSPILEVTALAQQEVTAPCPTPSPTAGQFDPSREKIGGS
ncbi:MAG: UbiD family decarboxylase, partial [Phycisphaerales bacterium]|nr:UbiD family decarboxylase [Phycisphaerales bacterium]